MRKLLSLLSFGLLSCGGPDRNATAATPQQGTPPQPPAPFHGLSATDINGNAFTFDQLKGKKVMVVNTASECGYTPQYAQLEEMYKAYKDKGLVIIGFPSNDFGGQEPGTEKDIAAFCQKNYGVTFPMMAKVSTKGDSKHAVYQWLTQKSHNGVMDSEVKWNFGKYLINPDGTLHTMLASATDPMSDAVLDWLNGKQ